MKLNQSVETEGSTIDEAIEKALEQLGAEREQVEIEIIADAAKGILGIGRKKARVRASVRPPIVEAVGKGGEAAPFAQAAPASEQAVSGRSAGAQAVTAGESGEAPGLSAGEAPERARRALEELLQRMGFAVTVSTNGESDDGAVKLSISGDQSGLLIGRHGQTLDALEYLAGRLAFRGHEAKHRVRLECGDYRERRKAALERMALKLGERVKKRGRTVTMEALSPRDRRIVHMALRADPAVVTRSAGAGYYRKLRIMPSGERQRERSGTTGSD